MLKFMDGFDHYAPSGTKGTVIQKYLAAAGYDIRNASDTTFSVVDGRRTGATALRFSTVAHRPRLTPRCHGASPPPPRWWYSALHSRRAAPVNVFAAWRTWWTSTGTRRLVN